MLSWFAGPLRTYPSPLKGTPGPAKVVRNCVDQCQFDLRALMLTTVALVADIKKSRALPPAAMAECETCTSEEVPKSFLATRP